jgi:hypothetical protein
LPIPEDGRVDRSDLGCMKDVEESLGGSLGEFETTLRFDVC